MHVRITPDPRGLSAADPAGFAAGAFAVAAATWTSLTLSPANGMRASPAAIGRILFRLVWQSAVAGADVAWRGLAPRLPLRPGLVRYPVRLAPGAPTSTFCMLLSLVPGTLPSGFDATGELLVAMAGNAAPSNQGADAMFAH